MAVYFIRDIGSGHIKIGLSNTPWARLDQLRVGAPMGVELLAAIDGDAKTERAVHQLFADLRVRGEWFQHVGALAAYLSALPPPAPREWKTKGKAEAFWNGSPSSEVAAKSGLSIAQVTRIQSGKSRPTIETAIKLQRLTGVSAVHLVFGDLAAEAIDAILSRAALNEKRAA